ncbi:MAG: hypothetical protein KAR40_18095 [Candidatus Sabulitectum sp.]|nr:hypothetical protein [Candidatus Sabulitectum sp.]
MVTDPKAFFRFAAKYYSILSDLYYCEDGLTDGELIDLIGRHLADDDPSGLHVMDRLQQLWIIEEVPGESSRWEVTHPVRALLRFLLREQRLTSVEVLQGYLKSLENSKKEIEKGIASGERESVVRLINDVSETVERLRADSADNYSSILNTCMEIKANKEHLPSIKRFEIINHLWGKYMVPMRDLIDIDKSMETHLDSLEFTLAAGMLRFGNHQELVRLLGGARSRILRMRRQAAADFHNALRDVEPLYETLKVDSEFARGASIAMHRMEKKGLSSLELDQKLPFTYWRTEGLLSDSGISVLLRELKGYAPEKAAVVTTPHDMITSYYITPGEVLNSLRDSLPVSDLLQWLNEYCEKGTSADILRLYGVVYGTPPGTLQYGSASRRYYIKGTEMQAYPISLVHHELE